MSRFADAVQMLLLGPSQSQLFLNLWARMRDNLAQGDPNRFPRFGQQMVGVMEILFAMFDCACLEAFGQLMCTGCGSSCLSHSGRLGHHAVRSSMQFAFDLQQEPELRKVALAHQPTISFDDWLAAFWVNCFPPHALVHFLLSSPCTSCQQQSRYTLTLQFTCTPPIIFFNVAAWDIQTHIFSR